MSRVIVWAFAFLWLAAAAHAPTLVPQDARAIAKEAYIWGFPIVDSYRVQYAFFVDKGGPEYKGAWNEIHNTARVYTPNDKAIPAPNSDTPYSWLGADLRAEPLVISVPPVERGRYYSAQFIDMYTFNFDYIGTRTTGNEPGNFLLAGPRWHGKTPDGIKKVIRSETDLAFVLFRTQLFGPDDIENVKKIQAGYNAQPLSAFLDEPAPPAAPKINWIKPFTTVEERTSLDVFKELNWLLQFMPTHSSEAELMAHFAKLDIGAGKEFNPEAFSPEIREAVQAGIADAWKEFDDFKTTVIDTGKVPLGTGFGTRAELEQDGGKKMYFYRMVAAALGIYANSKAEAIYPSYFTDAKGRKLDGSKGRYQLRFMPGHLPPTKAFWSLTVYELPSLLLVPNSLNRYLANSPMLPSLKPDWDGGLTLYVQHSSPGKELESNWLPTPNGAFFMILRVYWPKSDALNGSWKPPPLERLN